MFVGLGLGYRAPLTRDNFRFAKQVGASHIVASLLHGAPVKTATGAPGRQQYVVSRPRPERWSRDALLELRRGVEAEGLRLAAVESLEPADWYDVLLDGPRREKQMAGLKQIVRNLGAAGIPALGYNFSLAGIWGRKSLPVARGSAVTWQFDDPVQPPIPQGMVWNQVYDEKAFASASEIGIGQVSSEELWRRYGDFLKEMVPVAEESGVKLALHPEDPPLPTLRGTPRLVYRPELYDRALELEPSPSNCMAVCIGTLAEMPGSDIYQAIDHLSRTGKIAYGHFRNVRGQAPRYREAFLDEGDTDMLEVLRILARNSYEGVLVPDHTPELSCEAPWHAGMAYALGWIRASLAVLGALSDVA